MEDGAGRGAVPARLRRDIGDGAGRFAASAGGTSDCVALLTSQFATAGCSAHRSWQTPCDGTAPAVLECAGLHIGQCLLPSICEEAAPPAQQAPAPALAQAIWHAKLAHGVQTSMRVRIAGNIALSRISAVYPKTGH